MRHTECAATARVHTADGVDDIDPILFVVLMVLLPPWICAVTTGSVPCGLLRRLLMLARRSSRSTWRGAKARLDSDEVRFGFVESEDGSARHG